MTSLNPIIKCKNELLSRHYWNVPATIVLEPDVVFIAGLFLSERDARQLTNDFHGFHQLFRLELT